MNINKIVFDVVNDPKNKMKDKQLTLETKESIKKFNEQNLAEEYNVETHKCWGIEKEMKI